MPRGNMPRQPSRSGRQEGVRPGKGATSKNLPARPAARRASPPPAKTPKPAGLK